MMQFDYKLPKETTFNRYFGKSYTVHHLQQVNPVAEEWKYVSLEYLTSRQNFIAGGLYPSDEGYVLSFVPMMGAYHKLTDSEIITLQAEGVLPNPLPEYHPSAMSQFFNYSASFFLVCTVLLLLPEIYKFWKKRKSVQTLGEFMRSPEMMNRVMQSYLQNSEEAREQRIYNLEVSSAWRERFLLIEKAGGEDFSEFKYLSFKEKMKIMLNPWGLIFGPLYLFRLGLYRSELSYMSLALVLSIVLDFIGLPFSSGWTAVAVMTGYRVNILYYHQKVLGKEKWW